MLSTADLVKSCVVGAVAFFVAAVTCRAAEPLLLLLAKFHLRVLLYIATVPLAMGVGRLGQWVVGSAPSASGHAIAVTAVQAAVLLSLHGASVGFVAHSVYRQPAPVVESFVAWQCFAAGSALLGAVSRSSGPPA